MARGAGDRAVNAERGAPASAAGADAGSGRRHEDARRDRARPPASKILSRRELLDCAGPGRSFRLVFTNGCFDLLHPGHVACLNEARALGDRLAVAVNTDASMRRLGKGSERPLVDEESRARVVAALECVDFVTLFGEDTPRELVAELLPDVLVKGGDYRADEVAGAATVRGAGGRVVIVPLLPGYSTRALIARVRGAGPLELDARSPRGDRSGSGRVGGGG